MSLDQNLFTLVLTPSKDDPNVIDLIDSSGVMHYKKRRLPGSVYKIEVYDPMSESLLITATAPSSTSKTKMLELCNPTLVVEVKYTGTLSFRWGFKWEEHEFEWKREECFMLRKPDPPVLVAVTKEPPGRLKTSSVQILDYNLNRFDIEDRKGLEIVILTALLTFQDSNESYHTPTQEGAAAAAGAAPSTSTHFGLGRKVSDQPPAANAVAAPPPPPPPKPAYASGVDRIAELQAAKGEYNEVIVEEEGSLRDYAQYCCNLLEDDAMLFVTVRSAGGEQVPKVLQVVEEAKRIRHKAGLSEDQELHQYVLYDTVTEPQKGPRRINLNDSDSSKNKHKYTPPNSLTIHLSKISMPELQPKAHVADKPVKDPKKKKKEDNKKKAPTPPPQQQPPKPSSAPASSQPSASSSSSPPRPPLNNASRPESSPSPNEPHQFHPAQPPLLNTGSRPLSQQHHNPNAYPNPAGRPPTHNSRPSLPNSTSPFPTPSLPHSQPHWFGHGPQGPVPPMMPTSPSQPQHPARPISMYGGGVVGSNAFGSFAPPPPVQPPQHPSISGGWHVPPAHQPYSQPQMIPTSQMYPPPGPPHMHTIAHQHSAPPALPSQPEQKPPAQTSGGPSGLFGRLRW